MAGPTTKPSLMAEADSNYEKLNRLIDSMTEKNYRQYLIFQVMTEKKKPIGKEIRIFEMFWRIDMNGISLF